MQISNQLIREIRNVLFQSGNKTLCCRLDKEINGNRLHLCDCFQEYLTDSEMHRHCMHGSCDEAATHLGDMLDKIAEQSGMEMTMLDDGTRRKVIKFDIKSSSCLEKLMRCKPYNQLLDPEDAERLKFLIEKYAIQFNGGSYQAADMTTGEIWKFVSSLSQSE